MVKRNCAFKKAFFDALWQATLSEMVAAIGNNDLPYRGEVERAAASINGNIKAHKGTLRSYQQTYRDEIVGIVDVNGDLAANVMCGMAADEGIVPPQEGSPEWNQSANSCRKLLIAAFKRPSTKAALRTMHIYASLHAGLRWDKGTNFTANHFYDFDHAAAALAYCDAFFTEGFLSNLINARHIRLDEINGCRTTNDVAQAVEILRTLSSSDI